MKFKILLVIILFSGLGVFAQNEQDEPLKNLVKQMVAAQTDFQPDSLDKILTADYIEISPVGEFDPREKVLGFYKPELKPPADKMSVNVEADEFSIRRYGDFAIVIARLNYKMTNAGKELPPRNLRVTFVCRQEKGVWKIASAQYTPMRSASPPQKLSS